MLPKTFPGNSILWDFFFSHNETHVSLPLSYGSIANDHESANVEFASPEADATKTGFVVRGDFQRGNHSILNIRMHAHMHGVQCHAYIHTYTRNT